MRKIKAEKEHLQTAKDLRNKLNKLTGSNMQTHDDLIHKLATQNRFVYVPGKTLGKKVYAFVDHGRWVAQCECGGAESVDLDSPIFFCCSCGNRSTTGRPREVVFPKEIEQIEAILLKRTDLRWKNWKVGESVESLEKEYTE
jgi:hypothetical protein